MSSHPELDGFDVSQLVQAFHRQVAGDKDVTFMYYSDVAWKLRERGEAGNIALWNEMSQLNKEKLRATLNALTAPLSANYRFAPLAAEIQSDLRAMLEKCLDDSDPLVIAEAIEG